MAASQRLTIVAQHRITGFTSHLSNIERGQLLSQKHPESVFSSKPHWYWLYVLLWLLGLVLLLTVSELFPDSAWVRKTFYGHNGLHRVLWVIAYLGLTRLLLTAWRPRSGRGSSL